MMDWKKVHLTVVGLLSFFLFVNVASAALPYVKYNYFQNWGGLNDNLSTMEIADNEATDIQNIIFDTGGTLKKRSGLDPVPSPADPVTTGTAVSITGLSFFKKNNGSRYLVAVSNSDGALRFSTKPYEAGGGPEIGSWDASWFKTIGSYDDDYLAAFSIAEDNLIVTTFTPTGEAPFKWTGTGSFSYLTTDTDVPDASINIYHRNHLFLNDLDYPSRIWFSALDDIEDYTATDFIDIQTNDGTQVRGFASTYNSLYIFKDKSIWRLSGYDRDSWFLEKMVDGIGTLSHQSIAIVNNFIYFITPQNDVATYDGAYTVKFISQKIRNTIGGLSFSRASSALGLPFSTYKYVDYDFYASVSTDGSGTNNRVLLFDTAYQAWSKFVGINASAWCVGDDSSSQNVLYFGNYDGYVCRYPAPSSYGDLVTSTSAIVSFYQTKWFRYSDISLSEKYWRILKTYVLTETSTDTYLTAEVRSDYETSGTQYEISISEPGSLWDSFVWDVDTWAGQTLLIDRREPEKGTDMFQLKYSNEIAGQGFTIFGWEIFIEPSDYSP